MADEAPGHRQLAITLARDFAQRLMQDLDLIAASLAGGKAPSFTMKVDFREKEAQISANVSSVTKAPPPDAEYALWHEGAQLALDFGQTRPPVMPAPKATEPAPPQPKASEPEPEKVDETEREELERLREIQAELTGADEPPKPEPESEPEPEPVVVAPAPKREQVQPGTRKPRTPKPVPTAPEGTTEVGASSKVYANAMQARLARGVVPVGE